jgi:putative transposase
VGRSRGGLSTKIHLATNEKGLPVRAQLTSGKTADIKEAKSLIRGLKAKALLADKGYTSKAFRQHLQRRRMKVVIPPKSNAKHPHKYSKYLYKQRNRIERCFNRLKHFRRLATRFDRNDAHYKATVTLAAIALWLKALYVD